MNERDSDAIRRGESVATSPEEQARKQLRRVGLGLLVLGVVVADVYEAFHAVRHRIREADRRFWRNADGGPGTIVIDAALSLLETTSPHRGGTGSPSSPNRS